MKNIYLLSLVPLGADFPRTVAKLALLSFCLFFTRANYGIRQLIVLEIF